MSPITINAAVKRITRQSILRWVVITIIALGGGTLFSNAITSIYGPPVYKRNATALLTFGPFLGIDVDRTRNSWCDLHPSRIIFTYATVDGKKIPMILPQVTNNFLWPVKGRQKFVVLLDLQANLPDGQWYVQSTFTNSCHWWNIFTGPIAQPTMPVGFEIKNHQVVTAGMEAVSAGK